MIILQAIILGIVQGLTEFLPISSSAHLVIIPWLFHWQDSPIFTDNNLKLVFDLSLHVGTALAVVGFFYKDLVRIFGALFTKSKERLSDRKLAWGLLLGSVPAALIGKVFEEPIENVFRSQFLIISILLIGFGILLWAIDKYRKKDRDIASAGLLDALWIGIAQTLALFPGVSRSGVTMTAGMALGLTRDSAARFSFLLMSPIVIGAAVYKLKDLRAINPEVLNTAALPMIIGCIVSFIVGILTIAFLLNFLKKSSFAPFAIYRFALGVVLIAVWLTR